MDVGLTCECDLQYVVRDHEIVDYAPYCHSPSGLWIRGPDPFPLNTSPFVVCLGAAQTFGPFCKRPFPRVLQQALGIPVVNFGYPGAGPAFFNAHPSLIGVANRAAVVVVQAMSGRSVDNSLFVSNGLERLTRRADGRVMGAAQAYRALLRRHRFRDRQKLRNLIAETRASWLEDCRKLLEQITVPKIALWFSVRQPDYIERYLLLRTMMGKFPHLVNRPMWEALAGAADDAVTCVTDRGLPQRLYSRFSGEPTSINPGAGGRPDLRRGLAVTMGGRLHRWTHNRYYPSPEMHEDAAKVLLPVLRQFL